MRFLKATTTVLLLMVFGILLAGCASSNEERIRDQNRSILEIRRAIGQVMGDPRQISQNQREFYSVYFDPAGREGFDANKARSRAYAKFVILGDRRPYDVSINVYIENRQSGRYVLAGEDKKTARELALELKTKLHQSQEGRNIIDEFRAF